MKLVLLFFSLFFLVACAPSESRKTQIQGQHEYDTIRYARNSYAYDESRNTRVHLPNPFIGKDWIVEPQEEISPEAIIPDDVLVAEPAPSTQSHDSKNASPKGETQKREKGRSENEQNPDQDDNKNSELPVGAPAADFSAKSWTRPTIYYQAVIKDDEMCTSSRRVSLKGGKGVELMRVCPQTRSTCLMEGSCRVSQSGKTRSFNIGNGTTFFELSPGDCYFGYGVKSICLDPFYTVAADPKYFRPGDVIYIPALVGLQLPNGSMHKGFFIVRDRGGMIKGPDRFDFFSGTMHWEDPGNPFSQARLHDQKTRLQYYRVTNATAQKVKAERQFPSYPH